MFVKLRALHSTIVRFMTTQTKHFVMAAFVTVLILQCIIYKLENCQLRCIATWGLPRLDVAPVTHYTLKLKFHWDQFPRNFPVASKNVTGKSPTSYEEVTCTRKLATFRPSRHVKMVWRRRQLPRNLSLTCYEEVSDVANKSARKLRGNSFMRRSYQVWGRLGLIYPFLTYNLFADRPTLRYTVTLTFDPLILGVCSVPRAWLWGPSDRRIEGHCFSL